MNSRNAYCSNKAKTNGSPSSVFDFGLQKSQNDLGDDTFDLPGATDATGSYPTNELNLPDISVTPLQRQNKVESAKRQNYEQLDVTVPVDNEEEPIDLNGDDDVQDLLNIASNLCERGMEGQALETYNRALQIVLFELSKEKSKRKSPVEQTIASFAVQIYIRIATMNERLEDYETAVQMCKKAHDLYRSHNENEENPLTQMMIRFEKAKETSKTRQRLKQHAAQMHNKAVSVHDAATKTMMFQRVTNTLYELLQMECESLGESHPSVATTIGHLGALNLEMNNTDIALEQFDTAAYILHDSLGPFHPKTGAAFRELGTVYASRRRDPSDLNRAIQSYEKAILALREGYGETDTDIGCILNSVAEIHIEQGEFDSAIETLSDALAVYEKHEVETGLHPDKCCVWKNLGSVYCQQKLWEIAIVSYTSALEIQKGERTNRTTSSSTLDRDLSDDQSLADTLEKLGGAAAAVGRHEDAIKTYTCALRIRKNAVEMAKSQLEIQDAQRYTARTLLYLAKVYESDGRLSEALSYYGHSLQLSHLIQNGFQCAVALTGIGSVHLKDEEFDKAIHALKGALNIFDGTGVPKDHKTVRDAKMKFIEAKFCQRSSLRHDSTVATLKEQLKNMTEHLHTVEEENCRLHQALEGESRRQTTVKQAESSVHNAARRGEQLLASSLNLCGQNENEYIQQTKSEVSDPSQSTSLADYLSRESVTRKSAGKDEESFDTKKLCLHNVTSGKDGFIVNIDFESLFHRELAEDNTTEASLQHTSCPIDEEEAQSLSSIFQNFTIQEATAFDLDSVGLSADKSVISLFF